MDVPNLTRRTQASANMLKELFPEHPTRSPPQPDREAPSAKKKRRRMSDNNGEESDEPYDPPRGTVSCLRSQTPCSISDPTQMSTGPGRGRPPSLREKKRPQPPIQIATVKVERESSEESEGGTLNTSVIDILT